MSEIVRFFQPEQVQDLFNFTRRLKAIGAAEMSLQGVKAASGYLLATTGPVLKNQGILDKSPLVLGMRTTRVAETPLLKRVVALDSIMERAPRIGEGDKDFPLPPAGVHAPWAGISPPLGNWVQTDTVAVSLLRDAAREGQAEIANGVGEAGAPEIQINKLRAIVWGRYIQNDIPAGVAFGAEVLGFLTGAGDDTEIPVYKSGKWLRLVASGGLILVRSGV